MLLLLAILIIWPVSIIGPATYNLREFKLSATPELDKIGWYEYLDCLGDVILMEDDDVCTYVKDHLNDIGVTFAACVTTPQFPEAELEKHIEIKLYFNDGVCDPAYTYILRNLFVESNKNPDVVLTLSDFGVITNVYSYKIEATISNRDEDNETANLVHATNHLVNYWLSNVDGRLIIVEPIRKGSDWSDDLEFVVFHTSENLMENLKHMPKLDNETSDAFVSSLLSVSAGDNTHHKPQHFWSYQIQLPSGVTEESFVTSIGCTTSRGMCNCIETRVAEEMSPLQSPIRICQEQLVNSDTGENKPSSAIVFLDKRLYANNTLICKQEAQMYLENALNSAQTDNTLGNVIVTEQKDECQLYEFRVKTYYENGNRCRETLERTQKNELTRQFETMLHTLTESPVITVPYTSGLNCLLEFRLFFRHPYIHHEMEMHFENDDDEQQKNEIHISIVYALSMESTEPPLLSDKNMGSISCHPTVLENDSPKEEQSTEAKEEQSTEAKEEQSTEAKEEQSTEAPATDGHVDVSVPAPDELVDGPGTTSSAHCQSFFGVLMFAQLPLLLLL